MGNYIDLVRGMMSMARHDGDTQLLRFTSGFIGDLERAYGKSCTSTEAATRAKALLKAINTTVRAAEEEGIEYVPDRDYVGFLKSFIPTELDETDIMMYFTTLMQTLPNPSKGLLMRSIKEKYPNQYDGKLAAKIAGSMFEPSWSPNK
jgi:hypothetical protein